VSRQRRTDAASTAHLPPGHEDPEQSPLKEAVWGLVRSVNTLFARQNGIISVVVLIATVVALSEILAHSAEFLLYGDAFANRVTVVTLIVTTMVSLPPIVLFVAAVKHLDRARQNQRRMRDKAEAENQAKSKFLANMSHELRTPLNAILGFSEVIKDEYFGPLGSNKYIDYAADIHDSGALLLEIIDDLLELSKIEAGSLELHEEEVDLPACVGAAVRIVDHRVRRQHIQLETRLDDGLPGLYADARLVKQMLLNLLSNAIKFTPERGRVVIQAERNAESGLVISVSDTGIGIAPEDIAKVLEPFGQVDNLQSRANTGTGLGLPLVQLMMQMHDGSLQLDSAVGQGTTVALHFPPARVLS